MKTLLGLFIQALPSLINSLKGMTPKERVITAFAALVAVFIMTLLVHFFGYETVNGAIDLFGDAVDEID